MTVHVASPLAPASGQAAAHALVASMLRRVARGAATETEVIRAVSEQVLDLLTMPSLADVQDARPIATATPISRGVVAGRVFTSVDALRAGQVEGPRLLLCDRLDNHALTHMDLLAGVLARREDGSSHATIVARGQGIPVVTDLADDDAATIVDGMELTLDGFRGAVYAGHLPIVVPQPTAVFDDLMRLLRRHSPLTVHANADTAPAVTKGAARGARGYEPRTEYMLVPGRAQYCLQRVLLSRPGEVRPEHLDELARWQRDELVRIYRAAGSDPVNVRLLDPPIHEFLPATGESRALLMHDLRLTASELDARINEVREENPMSGTRGARLLLARPEVLRMQAEAILRAALQVAEESGLAVEPRITIPMIIDVREVVAVRALLDEVRDQLVAEANWRLAYRLGIMMQTPRAALWCAPLASEVDYVSFGTNDLTGQVFALSRGDVYSRFLGDYLDRGILTADPFVFLDESVRGLLTRCVTDLRETKPDLDIGLCGEQAGQRETVEFCADLGMNAISVAPSLIALTLLRAAQHAVARPCRNVRTAP
jgi:pyruvate,orthophosphate dikinase